jgi:K+-sensing histidine kinase KdpD
MELEHLKLKESMDIEIMKSKESMDIEIMKSKESMNIATMKSKGSMDIATMKSKDSMNIEIMKSNERKAIDQKNPRFALLPLVVGTALILAFLLLFVQSAVFIRDGLLGKKSSNITIFTFLAVAIAQIMQGMVPAVNFAKWIVNVTYSFFR